MAYDLLVKNGLIVDGSGMPSFYGDVAVKNGKILETGKTKRPGGPGNRRRGPGYIAGICGQPLSL